MHSATKTEHKNQVTEVRKLQSPALLNPVAPLVHRLAPMRIDSIYSALIVLVFILLEAAFFSDISRHERLHCLEITELQLFVNLLGLRQRILLEIFETDLHEMSFRDEGLVRLISVVKLRICLDNLVFKFLFTDVLKLESLDGVLYETHRGLIDSERIAHHIDELRIRIKFQKCLHMTGMRRILAEELLLSAHVQCSIYH